MQYHSFMTNFEWEPEWEDEVEPTPPVVMTKRQFLLDAVRTAAAVGLGAAFGYPLGRYGTTSQTEHPDASVPPVAQVDARLQSSYPETYSSYKEYSFTPPENMRAVAGNGNYAQEVQRRDQTNTSDKGMFDSELLNTPDGVPHQRIFCEAKNRKTGEVERVLVLDTDWFRGFPISIQRAKVSPDGRLMLFWGTRTLASIGGVDTVLPILEPSSSDDTQTQICIAMKISDAPAHTPKFTILGSDATYAFDSQGVIHSLETTQSYTIGFFGVPEHRNEVIPAFCKRTARDTVSGYYDLQSEAGTTFTSKVQFAESLLQSTLGVSSEYKFVGVSTQVPPRRFYDQRFAVSPDGLVLAVNTRSVFFFDQQTASSKSSVSCIRNLGSTGSNSDFTVVTAFDYPEIFDLRGAVQAQDVELVGVLPDGKFVVAYAVQRPLDAMYMGTEVRALGVVTPVPVWEHPNGYTLSLIVIEGEVDAVVQKAGHFALTLRSGEVAQFPESALQSALKPGSMYSLHPEKGPSALKKIGYLGLVLPSSPSEEMAPPVPRPAPRRYWESVT